MGPGDLKRARLGAGLTTTELGDRLGVTRNQVERVEQGKRGTDYRMAARWFEACGLVLVPVDEAQAADAHLVRRFASVLPRLQGPRRAVLLEELAIWERQARLLAQQAGDDLGE